MPILPFGILLLLAFMALVMGAPLAYYLKRDQCWKDGDARSIRRWYGNA